MWLRLGAAPDRPAHPRAAGHPVPVPTTTRRIHQPRPTPPRRSPTRTPPDQITTSQTGYDLRRPRTHGPTRDPRRIVGRHNTEGSKGEPKPGASATDRSEDAAPTVNTTTASRLGAAPTAARSSVASPLAASTTPNPDRRQRRWGAAPDGLRSRSAHAYEARPPRSDDGTGPADHAPSVGSSRTPASTRRPGRSGNCGTASCRCSPTTVSRSVISLISGATPGKHSPLVGRVSALEDVGGWWCPGVSGDGVAECGHGVDAVFDRGG